MASNILGELLGPAVVGRFKAKDPGPLQRIQGLQDWLKPTDSDSPASEYRKHLYSHAPGTGEWIFETDQYRDWSTTDSVGNLWIRGIPGCGKSVVAANLISRLQQLNNGPVLFFFFREIVHSNRSPQSLLQDFCHKLIDSSLHLQSALEQLRKDFPAVESVPFDQFWECLATGLQSVDRVYCVVDALDEMEQGHDRWLEQFLDLGRQFPRSIKIITTSRQVPHVEKHMQGTCIVDLRLDRLHVDQDISVFVMQHLKESQLDLGLAEIEDIKKAICENGKGLFLYARLMLDELLRDPKDIQIRVHNLPNGLGDMYTNLLRDWATRSGTSTHFQRLILEWITHSARPLRLLELTAMIESLPDRGGLDPECNVKNAVRTTCGPLLEVCEDGAIQIIHHSLTEFLLNRDVEHTQMMHRSRDYATIDPPAVHTMIARTCLQYLTNGPLRQWEITKHGGDRPSDRKSLFLKFYFLRYAVLEWPFHVNKAGGSNDELLGHLDTFCKDGSHDYEAWNDIWRADRDDIPNCCSVMHITAYAGLVPFASYLLSRGSDPDVKDEDGHTPLVYAVMKGQHEMVSILLQHGASHDIKIKSKDYTPPQSLITYACRLNHVTVIRALINGGVDPMAKDTIGGGITNRFSRRPDPWDGPSYPDPCKDVTALASACEYGRVGAVLELIRLVDPFYLYKDNLLHFAAQKGKDWILSALLKHEKVRLAINDRDTNGDTPIYLAARNRSAPTIKILLHHGADVMIRSMNKNFPPEPPIGEESRITPAPLPSYTPLHAWAFGIPRGYYNVAKNQDLIPCLELLLNAGCDINARDHRGRTVLFEWPRLHWADMSGEDLVTALLERGADATVVDFNGETPLHSTERVNEKVARLLVNHGCNINAQRRKDGLSVLMCNAMQQNHGDPSIFHGLGADFDQQDWLGNTALHHNFKRRPAGKSCHIDGWLSKSNLHIQNHLGRTPLHEFLYRQNEMTKEKRSGEKNIPEDLVEMIKRGVSLESRDGLGRTALLIALVGEERNSLKLVEELLRLGASAQAIDYEGKSPLHYAFKPSANSTYLVKDDNRCVLAQCLIDAGASIEAIDHKGNNIFHDFINDKMIQTCGSWSDFEKRAEAIIELGVPYRQANYQGRTALHAAAAIEDHLGYSFRGGRTRLEFLLQSSMHFDVNAKDNDGITPLHLASAVSDINALTLIQHGADIQAKDNDGRTPLHFAARAGQSNVVGLLLEIYQHHSIPIDHQCVKRRSALHEASQSGSPESVKLLLDAGADPSLSDERGRTALHAAAEIENTTPAQKAQIQYYSEPPLLAKPELTSRLRRTEKSDFDKKDAFSRMGLGISHDEDARCAGEVVRLLLAAGAQPHQVDENGHHPLDVAVMLGCAPVVQALKRNVTEPPVHSLDPFRESLLTLSDAQMLDVVSSVQVPDNYIEFLERLFATGNEVLVEEFIRTKQLKLFDSDDKSKRAGIFLLPRLGLTSMMKRLLLYLDDATSMIPTLLARAAERSLCNLEMVKLLMQQLPREDRNVLAASLAEFSAGKRWWHPKALSILLEGGVDAQARVSAGSQSAISKAVSTSDGTGKAHRHKWNGETLRILLKHGADPNDVRSERESPPLHTAVRSGADAETITLLLDHGASLDSGSSNLINSAIRQNNLAMIELLLKAGADANGTDNKREVPLLQQVPPPQGGWESRSEREAVMSLLLRYGADPLRPIENGSTTVLHELCAETCNPPIGPILAVGVDINIIDSEGRTPLMKTCMNNRDLETGSAVLELIEAGADIHAADHVGCTSLYYAAEHGGVDIVAELLKRSAAISARNTEGFTPLTGVLNTYAESCTSNHFAILNMLLDARADPLGVLPDGRTALHCIATALMDSSNVDRKEQIKEDGGEDHFTEATSLYQRFLDAACDREACDNNGDTPIFHYVRAPKSYNGHDHPDFAPMRSSNPEDYTKMFAEHDVHKTNLAGDTLLHVIARRGESPCDTGDDEVLLFKTLVGLGLNPWKENNDGQTALDIAASQEKTKILALFARKE
ncbi:uncharacterized protein N7498_003302 [Penicillium cinerascens]|uniref:NACHT domain-containing protein n=1 Tax=Penicillium cinerascens TaxID=70096 RepID=A0A9W9T706_9EURO|nr:uncharacterized protein N7498_003302 [Penicillium cinerascens]KAJ5211656.1 hypothetical protein N7498_003302 [Penicillium cinerascens]